MTEKSNKKPDNLDNDAPDFLPNESEYNYLNFKSMGILVCEKCHGRIQTDLDFSKFCPAYTKERQNLCPMLEMVV